MCAYRKQWRSVGYRGGQRRITAETGVVTVAESDPIDTATAVVIGPATDDTGVAPALAASLGETFLSVLAINFKILIFSTTVEHLMSVLEKAIVG